MLVSPRPRSLSLESVISSPLSQLTNLGDMPVVAPRISAPSARRHERYYFSDGNVIFLVEGVLYNIHRYFLQRDSSSFASMFSLPFGGRGQGLMEDEPIPLAKIKAHDFDLFLSILYPAEFGLFAAGTVDEWTAILDLAAKWNFKSIKALAIRQLAPIASSIDKIVLGRKHDIHEWLGDAYRDVCVRPDPLTYEEGMRLGMGDVIDISAIRHDSSLGMMYKSSFSLSGELWKRFGIDVETRSPVHDVPKAENKFSEPQELKYVEDNVEEPEAQKDSSFLGYAPFPEYPRTPIKEVAYNFSPPTWSTSDEMKRAEEPAYLTSKDDNLGPNEKPLTKAQLKKKKQQQEKEGREFKQERLERELQEEANLMQESEKYRECEGVHPGETTVLAPLFRRLRTNISSS